MRQSMLLLAIVSASLFIGGCGEAKIDASSEETFKKSVEAISKGLDATKKDKFEQAVAALMMKNVLFAAKDEASATKAMKDTFDGKTADQVIAEGEKAKASTDANMKKMMQGK